MNRRLRTWWLNLRFAFPRQWPFEAWARVPLDNLRHRIHERAAAPIVDVARALDILISTTWEKRTMSDDPQVTATCQWCDWSAKHKRGDTVAEDLEVAKLLRRLSLEHIRNAHPEKWGRG